MQWEGWLDSKSHVWAKMEVFVSHCMKAGERSH